MSLSRRSYSPFIRVLSSRSIVSWFASCGILAVLWLGVHPPRVHRFVQCATHHHHRHDDLHDDDGDDEKNSTLLFIHYFSNQHVNSLHLSFGTRPHLSRFPAHRNLQTSFNSSIFNCLSTRSSRWAKSPRSSKSQIPTSTPRPLILCETAPRAAVSPPARPQARPSHPQSTTLRHKATSPPHPFPPHQSHAP